jgi:hypothetical protein
MSVLAQVAQQRVRICFPPFDPELNFSLFYTITMARNPHPRDLNREMVPFGLEVADVMPVVGIPVERARGTVPYSGQCAGCGLAA